MSKYVACPGCGVRLMGSICYYKSCLDTAVRLWEWKISARVCSHCCSTSRRDVWSEALPWGAPGLEPAARSQTRALGQRGCWQPERSGSRHRSGKLAFTSQGCPPGCFGEEQKRKMQAGIQPASGGGSWPSWSVVCLGLWKGRTEGAAGQHNRGKKYCSGS